ncbi:MAG: DUF2262 domain-containing protein [Armatimonadetes bacterium]|nr:DUF2262 domain-containing protein [Armatimonadota bacterium]
MNDRDLGALTWNDGLDWWEGSLRLSSEAPFHLYILAREGKTSDRAITADARRTIERLRHREADCRRYAAEELLDVHNAEWSDGNTISGEEFVRRLTPDSIEVHETGYAEIHFGDGELFWGHGVGVRVGPDGSFQEAVVEG